MKDKKLSPSSASKRMTNGELVKKGRGETRADNVKWLGMKLIPHIQSHS